LGQVSGGLAHQLRNGVAGARLAVQLHARECSDPADGEALAVALRQLALVELHLKRFLDLGRAAELKRTPCDLIEIIKDTMTLLGPQCSHAHIDLRWRDGRPAESSVVVDGDAEHLRHLFLNVLTNAIEAAGPGGWVEVECRREEGRAVTAVRDSGPGPSPEVADRLFEPFVTGKAEGVGLGLAVARQAAQAHGGTIRWSRAERGTCFCVEMPLLDAGT
jgi:signal transduction histidine kinase